VTEAQPVRVLLVDDDALMRAGLRAVLSSDDSIAIAGEAADGADGVERARELGPDLVVMDVRMPGRDGISATPEVIAAAPEARVLILTTFEQDDYVFGALQAGASGFLLKRARPEELIAAVHAVAAGDSLLSPSVTRTVIDRLACVRPAGNPCDAGLEELTPRELEVLGLVARGLSNAEIAAELVIEESTVKDPRQARADEARASRSGPGGDLRVRERARPACATRLSAASTGSATNAHESASGSHAGYGSLNALQRGARCTARKPAATATPTAAAYGAASWWPRATSPSRTASAIQPAIPAV
jgi:DNA-binding NarL/FixJ family response regulator